MASLTYQNVPDHIHESISMAANREGSTVRDYVLKALEDAARIDLQGATRAEIDLLRRIVQSKKRMSNVGRE